MTLSLTSSAPLKLTPGSIIYNLPPPLLFVRQRLSPVLLPFPGQLRSLDHPSLTLLPVLSFSPCSPSITPAQKNRIPRFNPVSPRQHLEEGTRSKASWPPACLSPHRAALWSSSPSSLPLPTAPLSDLHSSPSASVSSGRSLHFLFQQGLKAWWRGTLSASYTSPARLSCHEGRVRLFLPPQSNTGVLPCAPASPLGGFPSAFHWTQYSLFSESQLFSERRTPLPTPVSFLSSRENAIRVHCLSPPVSSLQIVSTPTLHRATSDFFVAKSGSPVPPYFPRGNISHLVFLLLSRHCFFDPSDLSQVGAVGRLCSSFLTSPLPFPLSPL